MKTKLLALVLAALILLAAPVSHAGWAALDDPAEGSNPWILPSAARAATTTTSGVINAPADARCVMLVVQTTAGTGFAIRTRVQVQDIATAAWLTVWIAPADITALSTFHYVICNSGTTTSPNMTGGAATGVGGIYMPQIFRVSVTAPDTTSVTYSVSGVAW